MKKVLALLSICLLTFSLVACGGKKMPDGIYTARVDEAYAAEYGHGWADELVLTYKDGVITEAQFNSYNQDGINKSSLSSDEYPMEPSPSEWMPQLAENIKNAASPDKIDTIAGATNSSSAAKALYEGILQNGKPGETIVVTVTDSE